MSLTRWFQFRKATSEFAKSLKRICESVDDPYSYDGAVEIVHRFFLENETDHILEPYSHAVTLVRYTEERCLLENHPFGIASCAPFAIADALRGRFGTPSNHELVVVNTYSVVILSDYYL